MFVGTIVETCGKEDSKGDKELVSRDKSTSNPGRSSLGFLEFSTRAASTCLEQLTLIHWHEQRKCTNTKPRDETTNHDLIPCMIGSNLDDEPCGHYN
jgi:hypothetical protein